MFATKVEFMFLPDASVVTKPLILFFSLRMQNNPGAAFTDSSEFTVSITFSVSSNNITFKQVADNISSVLMTSFHTWLLLSQINV